jgi:hypothetical protein
MAHRSAQKTTGLCLETQGREVMARLVNDVVAEAMRLDLHGAPAERIEKANGARLARRAGGNRNG